MLIKSLFYKTKQTKIKLSKFIKIIQFINNLSMVNTYQIYLISDSTGETLERIFLALKAQFKNIEYKIHSYSFTRTENQNFKNFRRRTKQTTTQ